MTVHGGIRTMLALVLLALALLACNLSNVPPTPTPPPLPTATNVPPLLLSPDVTLPPPNPNCATTPLGWIPYTVEPGDSLGLLAEQTESTVDELAQGNCMSDPNQIEVGAVIYLPRQPVIGG